MKREYIAAGQAQQQSERIAQIQAESQAKMMESMLAKYLGISRRIHRSNITRS